MNKGEWSEFYAFLKLLADGELYGADGQLVRVEAWKYPVKSIVRENTNNDHLRFVIHPDLQLVKIEYINHPERQGAEVEQAAILQAAEDLLLQIKEVGTFTEATIQQFIEDILLPKIKAKNLDKTDISVVLHDINVGREQEFGFSIKSQLGGASTLLNAGQATNFIYEVVGFSELDAARRAEISEKKARSLVTALLNNGCSLNFVEVEHRFRKNLRMIDSRLDEISAHILRLYYSQDYLNAPLSKISDLANNLETNDPLGFASPEHRPYIYKIKQLLSALALGLTPAATWTGIYDASGGYLIVKDDGSLVCYHLYNWNAFQDYLFSHTSLDTPSTTRHLFGKLYQENGKDFIKLNMQIRFDL